MRVLVIIFIAVHLTNAFVPPFTEIFSGLNPLGLNAETDSDQKATAGGISSRFGGILGGPRQIAGDVLGAKVGILTALRNVIIGEGEVPLVEGVDSAVDGMGTSISGFESSGSSSSSQAFSANSGFASMSAGKASTSSASGYSNSQNLQPPSTSYGTPNVDNGNSYNRPESSNSGYAGNAGYNYNRPPSSENSGYAPIVQNIYGPPSTGNGYAANGGYNYNRPNSGHAPNVQNTYGPPNSGYTSQGITSQGESSSSGISDTTFNAASSSDVSISQVGGASDFSSGSSSTLQATQSGTAALSENNDAKNSQRNQGIPGFANSLITSGVQIPINLLNSYRSGVNRGFDTVSSGIEALQRIFGNLGASSDNSNSDSIQDDEQQSSFNLDSSNDLRRRFF